MLDCQTGADLDSLHDSTESMDRRII